MRDKTTRWLLARLQDLMRVQDNALSETVVILRELAMRETGGALPNNPPVVEWRERRPEEGGGWVLVEENQDPAECKT